MSKAFTAKIYTADSTWFEGELESLVVPTSEGMYGILADHRNVVVAVIPGLMHYNEPGGETVYAKVSEGMLRMEDGEVLVLCGFIIDPEKEEELRRKEAEEEKKEAALQKRSVQEYREAEMTLQRTAAGLRNHDIHHEIN